MHPLLKRVALNGTLAALVLGLIGWTFAELAAIWLAGSMGRSAAPLPGDAVLNDTLRSRVPLTMAAWGFLFVAIGEVLLSLWRGRRPTGGGQPAPAGLKPDTAEVLLDEILRQIESARTQPGADSILAPDPSERPIAAAPTPSAATRENSDTPELVPGVRGA